MNLFQVTCITILFMLFGKSIHISNGGIYQPLFSLNLIIKVSLSLKLKVYISNDSIVLGLEVPDFPSNFSSNCNPVTAKVESKTVNWCSSILLRSGFLNITKIKNSDLLVISTSNNKSFLRERQSYCVDGGIMNLDTVFNAEGMAVSNFEVAVSANRSKVLPTNWIIGRDGNESDFAHPVGVVLLFNDVFCAILIFLLGQGRVVIFRLLFLKWAVTRFVSGLKKKLWYQIAECFIMDFLYSYRSIKSIFLGLFEII